MREVLEKLRLRDATVQSFGSSETALIRLPARQDISGAQLSREGVRGAEARRSQQWSCGAWISSDRKSARSWSRTARLALLLVSIRIVLYLWLRFEWKFGVSAIIANLHDVVIILGFFAFFQWEFSLPVLAAVLAVLGYSVNESVVVFDRIRENFRKMRKASVPEVINNAITRTMSRTIITHGCTQFMVTSILFFGGDTLFYFALALTIGILFGIYSSVLVASPLVMWLGVSREDLVKPEKKPKQEAVV